MHLQLEVPCCCNDLFHSLFELTCILKTNSHFFWHFPVLNMEGISNFVIILLHCYRSARCSRCTRRLSDYRTSDRSLLWTLQLFCSLEVFFSTSGMLIFVWLWIHINIFDFVALWLSWLFLLFSAINFCVTLNWISLLYFDSQVVHDTFYYITDTFYFLHDSFYFILHHCSDIDICVTNLNINGLALTAFC